METQELLRRAKDSLKVAYGDTLEGLILYGSYAKGTAQQDSDIDLVVLLKKEIALGEDMRRIIDSLYHLQLEYFVPIHAIPVNIKDFRAGEYAFYRQVKKEGISV